MDDLARRDTLRPFSQHSDAPSVYSPASGHPPRHPWHPNASVLEFSDDSRSSHYNDNDDNDNDLDSSRMSMLGPKMRFHSPAPWETGDEGIPEEDASYTEPTRRKPFHFGTSSPRTSHDSRASVESSRAKLRKAQDPDRGRHQFQVPGAQYQNSLKLPSSRLQYSQSAAVPSFQSSSSSVRSSSPQDYESSYDRSRSSSSSSSSPDEGVHPFANPKHAYHRHDPAPPPSPARSTFSSQAVSRSDSSATVTSFGNLPYVPTSPTPPADREARPSPLRKWDISSPLPVQSNGTSQEAPFSSSVDPAHPSSVQSGDFTGYPDRSGPAFHLISLEEAREQRKRSATADSVSVASSAANAGPYQDMSDRASISSGRTRARSVSAGAAKAKNALQSMANGPASPVSVRRDSEPAVKPLKHKKSGFMRLFNGQKERDDQPPPVPALLETYSIMNAQNASQNPAPKITSHRVPVPPISTGNPDYSASDEHKPDTPSSGTTTRHSPSPSRKPPPPLSIRTERSPDKLFAQSAGPGLQTQTLPSSVSESVYDQPSKTLPQSAPANVLQFPALRLRPISTTFSAKFGEEFISRESQPFLDADLSTSTSTSPTSAMSPLTPGISSRSVLSGIPEKMSSSVTPRPTEDQSAIIQSLQEQIVSAKKAWQRHIWELEGQVRDLKAEVEDLRATNNTDGSYCATCGRGDSLQALGPDLKPLDSRVGGVINRPRARTGISSSRFGAV